MAGTGIDEGLNRWLGLPDGYQLNKMEAFKIYSYLISISHIDMEVDAGRFEFYIDKNGDFVNNPQNKRDYVMKASFDNMEMSDQFSVLSYIEYWRETNGFKDL